jgi:hypothetical protein
MEHVAEREGEEESSRHGDDGGSGETVRERTCADRSDSSYSTMDAGSDDHIGSGCHCRCAIDRTIEQRCDATSRASHCLVLLASHFVASIALAHSFASSFESRC